MSHRLLVVDDSLTIQKVVELILKPEGYEILALSDGEQALQSVATFAPEIVLADVDMPSLTGYDLCERLRNEPATAHIPVVLLTGAFEPFDEQRARAVNASDVIVKPFETRELITKVEHLLSGRGRAVTEAPEPREAVAAPEEAVAAAPAAEPVAAAAAVEEEAAGLVRATAVEAALPAAELAQLAREVIGEKVSAFIREELAPSLSQHLREDIRQSVASMVPPIVETVTRELTAELAALLRKDFESMAGEMLSVLASELRESVRALISGALPGVLEGQSRQILGEMIAAVRPEMDASLKRVVPEVAERLIQKEIEKITADL